MLIAVVMFIFVAITAVVTAMISGWVSDTKQQKVVNNMKQDYKEKINRKEEVIKNANEKKSEVNSNDVKSSFDSSIDILQDLSRRRK